MRHWGDRHAQTDRETYLRGVVVTDGGLGTQLRPAPAGQHLQEAWNLEHSGECGKVARAYVRQQADRATNSFGANRFVVGPPRTGGRGRADWGPSRSPPPRPRVEPTVRSMAPRRIALVGRRERHEVREAFAVAGRALAEEGGPRIGHRNHVRRERSPAGRIGRGGDRSAGGGLHGLRFGSRPRPHDDGQHARAGGRRTDRRRGRRDRLQLRPGDRRVHRHLPPAAAATDRPVWIKANAGLPQVVDGQTVYAQTPDAFAETVPALVEAGASFVGGCCGTTPEFIQAVRRKLSS